MERHYYTINLYDKFKPSHGYSVCVWSFIEESEESLIQSALALCLIDADDVKEMNVVIAEITNDEHEMAEWIDEAVCVES